MKEEDYDLYYHALNYRTASSQHAEAAWQKLLACHYRLLAREKENTEYGWKNVRILEKAYQDVRGKLDEAIERMDRARSIITNGHPSKNCNWGMLDTIDLR